ncbi:hypothetical protein [Dactylosporangium sp. CA-139066]|uniref:5'-methylthioadenosine/S-adenosylhomocysteine nucleosidase family protein n=1 Tax=Dactylosporangium sp. CA-139066 TaxID=3239930 RepID=UPI003D8DC7B5
MGGNYGIYSTGGTVNVGGDVAGTMHKTVRPDPVPGPVRAGRRADVGILTVLTEELVAVVEMLQRHDAYRAVRLAGGAQAHTARIPAEGGALTVTAMQTLDRGGRSAALAYQRLRHEFDPAVVLLVGIAGGVSGGIGGDPDRRLTIGDVVVADEVVYYDARRETRDGPRRRGSSQPMAAALRHRLNEFFRRWPGRVPVDGVDVRVWRGPIGSGDAVITDAGSDILEYLRRFNEKMLAVETEAGGVGQAFYEELDGGDGLVGWLTIRGISDLADEAKRHDSHRLAARNAAAVTERLLPLLRVDGDAS